MTLREKLHGFFFSDAGYVFSFWGRLGMQNNRTNRKFIHDPAEFYDLMMSGRHHITSFDLIDENCMQVVYKLEDGFAENNPTTNVVLAA